MLLVVEDDAYIQYLLESKLADAGYNVVTACDGRKAIAELNADAGRFRGVITDIRLGTGPNGWEVSRHARVLVPDMPIVYMTADSSFEWSSRGVPGSVLFTKPFALDQFTTAVSALLTEADGCRTVTGSASLALKD